MTYSIPSNFLLTLFVRSSSSRFPSKYSSSIHSDTSLLETIIVKSSAFCKPVYALPYIDINSHLHEYIINITPSANIYFGSNENLIKRAFGCTVLNGGEWLIRYTCDDPCKDFEHLQDLIKYCQDIDPLLPYLITSEYSNSPVPIGMGWEIYSFGALQALSALDFDSFSSEHIRPAYEYLKLPIHYYGTDISSSHTSGLPSNLPISSEIIQFSIDKPSDVSLFLKLSRLGFDINAEYSYSQFASIYFANDEFASFVTSSPSQYTQFNSPASVSFSSKQRFSSDTISYISSVLDSNLSSSLSTSFVDSVQDLFSQRSRCSGSIAMCNGTATLITALKAIGIKEGDEVIVSPLTMSSPSIAILACGAIPVWCDIDPETLLITADSIDKVKTDRTVAVIFVSLYGSFIGIDQISHYCRKSSLFLIEDNAESDFPLQNGEPYHLKGDFASYSFQSSKNFTTGEGGILTCKDKNLWIKALYASGLGYVRNSDGSRISKNSIQSVNSSRHSYIGENYRLSEILASILYSQLEDEGFLLDCRRRSVRHQSSLLDSCKSLSQLNLSYKEFSGWGLPLLFKDKAFAANFVQIYNSYNNRNCYPAWRLASEEPAFDPSHNYEQLKSLLRSGYLRYTSIFNATDISIPNALSVRPRLVGLRTNHWCLSTLSRDCDALQFSLSNL